MSLEKTDPKNNDSAKIGKLVLLILVMFFLVIFTVDAIFIYNAEKSWRGIVTEDSYRKGLHYNQTIESARKQAALGWKADINYIGPDNGQGILAVVLRDKNGRIINNGKVSARLIRPTQ